MEMDIYILGEGKAAIFITNDEKDTIMKKRYDDVDSLVQDVLYKADSRFPRGRLSIRSLELQNGVTLLVSSEDEDVSRAFYYIENAEKLMDAAQCLGRSEYEVYSYECGYIAAVSGEEHDVLMDFAKRLQRAPAWICHLREHGHRVAKSGTEHHL